MATLTKSDILTQIKEDLQKLAAAFAAVADAEWHHVNLAKMHVEELKQIASQVTGQPVN